MNDLLRQAIVFASVLFSSLLLLLFVRREVHSVDIDASLVIIFSLSKTVFFISEMFRHIERTATNDIGQQRIFAMAGLYAILFVVSFAFDHWAILEVDAGAISGVSGEGVVQRMADMLYYSISTFTTAGFGDLVPVSRSARFLASEELILSFFLTVLVIANFTDLRSHFRSKRSA